MAPDNFDVFDPAPYRASKAAIDSLTKHLARRHAKESICVNSIAPAMTRTDLFDVVSPDVLAQALAGMPQGKPMEPQQIASWVAFWHHQPAIVVVAMSSSSIKVVTCANHTNAVLCGVHAIVADNDHKSTTRSVPPINDGARMPTPAPHPDLRHHPKYHR
jgi:NAD(P)-dependent dehydrogenase (short-subunit alcohol dehydrogenase family)